MSHELVQKLIILALLNSNLWAKRKALNVKRLKFAYESRRHRKPEVNGQKKRQKKSERRLSETQSAAQRRSNNKLLLAEIHRNWPSKSLQAKKSLQRWQETSKSHIAMIVREKEARLVGNYGAGCVGGRKPCCGASVGKLNFRQKQKHMQRQ